MKSRSYYKNILRYKDQEGRNKTHIRFLGPMNQELLMNNMFESFQVALISSSSL